MTTFVDSRQQRAALQRDLPGLLPPTLLGAAYLAPDLQVTDAVDFVLSGTTRVYPFPTPNNSINKNGTAVASGASPSYTIQPGDVGSVLVVSQNPSNSYGSDTRSSASVTVAAQRTAANQGWFGGNVGSPASYSTNIFMNNGVTGGLNDFGTGSGTGYHSPVDSNGFPTTASTWWLSSSGSPTINGQLAPSVDGSSNPLLPGDGVTGQLAAYRCTYQSGVTNTSADVTVASGSPCTIANWQSLGSGKYYFELTVPIGALVGISFAKAIQFPDCPRNGVTPSSVAGEFYPPNLANAAQCASIRLMDLCNANQSTETTWASRVPDYGQSSPTTNNIPSWERIFRYINAVYGYSGSLCKQFWITIPGKVDDNYITQLATLANSMVVAGVHLVVEWWNEVWNNTNLLPQSYCFDQAYAESWTLLNYAGDSANPVSIASITASGGVATVTLNKNINQYFKQDGTTPFITNGALCYAVNQSQANYNGTNTGTSVGLTPAAQVQVAITTGGALAANQFSYPCAAAASGAMPASNHAFLFNVASNLVNDQLTFDLNQWWKKFFVRRSYQISALWKAIRPSDEIVLGLQQFGTIAPGGGDVNFSAASPIVQYGNWLGDGTFTSFAGLRRWCDILAIAPYVFPLTNIASTVNGTNVVHNVPWAAYAVAGDSVQVGPSASSVNTVVVSGSGTDLTVADNITFTGTNNVAVTYGRIPEITCYVVGNTLTVTSMRSSNAAVYICKGAALYGHPSIPAGTVITAFGTGTGGMGTYTLNNSFTLYSSGAPNIAFAGQADTVATLQAMLLGGVAEAKTYIRSHAYICAMYGLKPFAYEGGPDTSKHYTKNVELWTYGQNNTPPSPSITMGTIINALYDAWFNAGGQAFHHFVIGPQAKADLDTVFGSNYAINQSFGDMTPAYAAFVAYATKALSLGTLNACPGTLDAVNNSYSPNGTLMTTGNAAGMMSWASNAAARQTDWSVPVGRSRRYQAVIWGSDSVACPVDLFADNVYIGTATLAANGAGNVSTTTPLAQTSPPIQIPFLLHGGRAVSTRIGAGVGGNAGIRKVVLTPY